MPNSVLITKDGAAIGRHRPRVTVPDQEIRVRSGSSSAVNVSDKGIVRIPGGGSAGVQVSDKIEEK